MKNKKRIICFGDSNTWGYDPATGGRYGEETRWPMRMQKMLGDAWQVIEEAQNGRTFACEDPWEWGTKSALDYVLPMVESHTPFDLLIIMLGTNDLKAKFHLPAGDIAGSLQNLLIRTIPYMQYTCRLKDAKILIVSPPCLPDSLMEGNLAGFFDESSAPKSRQLAYWFRLVADQFSCAFFDAGEIAELSPLDHLHLSPEGHHILAEKMADQVKLLLG